MKPDPNLMAAGRTLPIVTNPRRRHDQRIRRLKLFAVIAGGGILGCLLLYGLFMLLYIAEKL